MFTHTHCHAIPKKPAKLRPAKLTLDDEAEWLMSWNLCLHVLVPVCSTGPKLNRPWGGGWRHLGHVNMHLSWACGQSVSKPAARQPEIHSSHEISPYRPATSPSQASHQGSAVGQPASSQLASQPGSSARRPSRASQSPGPPATKLSPPSNLMTFRDSSLSFGALGGGVLGG